MLWEDKFKEECGVFGIYSKLKRSVSTTIYHGLYALQHRGEDSSGIAVYRDEKLKDYKKLGLVCNVFNREILNDLDGNLGIGHVRYSTSGVIEKRNAQPILGKFKNSTIAMAHNGNLVNGEEIKKNLEKKGYNFKTTLDSEVILKLIELEGKGKDIKIEKAIIKALKNIKGSYSLVFLKEDKLIGVRDPKGIRPLCIGKLKDDYILSSESCALDCIGAEFIRDVEPGEIVTIDHDGIKSIEFNKRDKRSLCIFEYIYFSRGDSVVDGLSVYDSRVRCGCKLFEESKTEGDVVVGVPESGTLAAEGYAMASKIPFKIGFAKNKYVGRTFIGSSQNTREEEVSIKLNPLKSVFYGKRVILIDDSIVRGNTSKHLVKIIKKAGAKEIHFKVASPIIKYPCYFGIATPNKDELIGDGKSIDEIREFLGVDSIGYLSIEGLIDVFKEKKGGFCLGCFNGKYPIDVSNTK